MNFKKIFPVLFIVIASCTFVNDPGQFESMPNIFCMMQTGDSVVSVIFDSTASIGSDEPDSILTVTDAEVFINGHPAVFTPATSDTLPYSYTYDCSLPVLPGEEYTLSATWKNKEYTASTIAPDSIHFKFIEDSFVLPLDTFTFLMWNSAGIGFYFVQFFMHTDSGIFNTFSIGVENDTFTPLFPWSILFSDSNLYTISVMAPDSNYIQYMMGGATGGASSYGDSAYGLFSAISSDRVEYIRFIKPR